MTSRCFLASVQFDGKIYAIGGKTSKGFPLNSVEVYDTKNDTWTLIEPMTIARSEASACVLNDRIFVVGGYSSKFGNTLACGEYYHIKSRVWTRISQMQSPRSNFSLVSIGHKIHAIGGWSFKSFDLVDIEEYDITSNKWKSYGKLLEPRFSFAYVTHGTSVYIIGGYNRHGFVSSLEVWDGINNKSHRLSSLPNGKVGASAIVLSKSYDILRYLCP